jgi:hypothetical protein
MSTRVNRGGDRMSVMGHGDVAEVNGYGVLDVGLVVMRGDSGLVVRGNGGVLVMRSDGVLVDGVLVDGDSGVLAMRRSGWVNVEGAVIGAMAAALLFVAVLKWVKWVMSGDLCRCCSFSRGSRYVRNKVRVIVRGNFRTCE